MTIEGVDNKLRGEPGVGDIQYYYDGRIIWTNPVVATELGLTKVSVQEHPLDRFHRIMLGKRVSGDPSAGRFLERSLPPGDRD